MIRIFRKSWRRSKRMVCAALCLVFLSSLLVIPAGAADEPYSLSARISGNGSIDGVAYSVPFVNLQTPSTAGYQSGTVVSETDTSSSDMLYKPWLVEFLNINQSITGSLGVYLSWYVQANFVGSMFSIPVSTFDTSGRLYVNNSEYSYVDTSSLEFSNFSAGSADGYTRSAGVLMKGRINNIDSMVNINRVWISFLSSSSYSITKPSGVPGALSLVVPSIVLIPGLSMGDLDALEGIADSIIAQSEIMSAYYGDIMQLLNDLYARLGDLQSVQETANSYFSQLIPLVNSINTNTANIYSLLQTQFQLLRTLIATESGDIQAAIEKQTDDLIAYFDTVFSGATGDMPEKSDDLQSSVGDFSDAESGYQSNATERFEELASTFSGFTGGTLAGVTLASTLFTRVWNALGQYNIVYYFPLLLGLSLVIIGRLPRGSGGQSSSEKHRGDSSA